MGASSLQTTNLELVAKTRDDVQKMIAAMTPYETAQLSADWLARFRSSALTDPWIHGFSAVHRSSGVVVGTGGFKGPPVDGAVEIAYGVVANHRGKGYATEIADALVSYALAFAEVDVVRAHTLPDASASKRVLVKCAFEHVGEVVDPEDGLVWRFERRRAARSRSTRASGRIAVNARGCYCDIWQKNPAHFESRGVPPGYCGFCERCRRPGHIRHFPGAVPYTGCWCDFHYRMVSLLHPLGFPGALLYYVVLLGAVGAWVALTG